MATKLVVCCDGTWNRPRTGTNVWQTYEWLRRALPSPSEKQGRKVGWRSCRGRAASGDEVRLFYDAGVGTGPFDRLAGGAFGKGLSENVCEAYRFLSRNYADGAEIYVMGFSRGAYTARSLCGFIEATGGLLVDASLSQVQAAYLDRCATTSRLVALGLGSPLDVARRAVQSWFGDSGSRFENLPRADVRIRFVGVYDTVGSLGVPLPRLARLEEPIVGFHDTALGPRIEHAVQALALDERRGPFRPTIWRLPPGASGLAAGQTCLQVWFPGVHTDVGGGYPDKGIGDLALDFMLRAAAERGLVLDPARPLPTLALQSLPAQHDSFDGLWLELSKGFEDAAYQRPVGRMQRAGKGDLPADAAGVEMLHPAVVDRLGQPVEVIREEAGGDIRATGIYRPASVPWSVADIRAGRADVGLFRARAELRLPAQGTADFGGRPCRLVDRSRSGARVRLNAPGAVGTVLPLDGRPGTIVWAGADEAGLRLH